MGVMGGEVELLLRRAGAWVDPPLRAFLGRVPIKQELVTSVSWH